jgi:hypothetical protein
MPVEKKRPLSAAGLCWGGGVPAARRSCSSIGAESPELEPAELVVLVLREGPGGEHVSFIDIVSNGQQRSGIPLTSEQYRVSAQENVWNAVEHLGEGSPQGVIDSSKYVERTLKALAASQPGSERANTLQDILADGQGLSQLLARARRATTGRIRCPRARPPPRSGVQGRVGRGGLSRLPGCLSGSRGCQTPWVSFSHGRQRGAANPAELPRHS